jgi:hypothetical protein
LSNPVRGEKGLRISTFHAEIKAGNDLLCAWSCANKGLFFNSFVCGIQFDFGNFKLLNLNHLL